MLLQSLGVLKHVFDLAESLLGLVIVGVDQRLLVSHNSRVPVLDILQRLKVLLLDMALVSRGSPVAHILLVGFVVAIVRLL